MYSFLPALSIHLPRGTTNNSLECGFFPPHIFCAFINIYECIDFLTQIGSCSYYSAITFLPVFNSVLWISFYVIRFRLISFSEMPAKDIPYFRQSVPHQWTFRSFQLFYLLWWIILQRILSTQKWNCSVEESVCLELW